MTRLLFSQEVHAPVDIVFDYVDRHDNHEKFFCGFSRFQWNTARHKAGTRLKMVAERIAHGPAELETTAVVPEREIAGIFVSGLRGQWEWLFQPVGGATRVTVMVDYDLPLDLLRQKVDPAMIEQEFRACVQKTLATLKQRLEAAKPTDN